ncbi:MAG: hypothetical protein ACRCV9_19035 [Burkholderiaceae bacterium]
MDISTLLWIVWSCLVFFALGYAVCARLNDQEQSLLVAFCEQKDLGAASEAGRLGERNRCQYPQCLETEGERCPRALTGECEGPSYGRNPFNIDQIVYAIERAERSLQRQADQLIANRDYSAEFPAADAQRMREALTILRSMKERTP